MSTLQSSVEWFDTGGGSAAPETFAPAAPGVLGIATAFVSSVPGPRQRTCLRAALAIACHGAGLFEPRYPQPAELRWCGSEGQPAPEVSFPADFVDRRAVVAWALYRLTVAELVDEPIFSAQARVTMHDSALATLRNFNRPVATVVASEAGVATLEATSVPTRIRQELQHGVTPMVYVVMEEPAGFDDVIFYTALFNFSRAFCAFQTGPWRAMKRALVESWPLCDSLGFTLSETRSVQRAALAATESAWEASYQQPIEAMQPMLLGILSHALSEVRT